MGNGLVFFFQEFVNKFLGQAPLLMGTVVFIGYLLLGKKVYQALAGFIKAYVGFKILQVGTGGLVKTFAPIINSLTAKFAVKKITCLTTRRADSGGCRAAEFDNLGCRTLSFQRKPPVFLYFSQ